MVPRVMLEQETGDRERSLVGEKGVVGEGTVQGACTPLHLS